MKRIIPLLLIFILFLFVSCSDIPKHSSQKVSILSVGLDYKDNIYTDLNGTINDAKEVGMALKSVYDKKGIDCRLEYMLQEELFCSYSDPMYPNRSNVIREIVNQNLDSDDLFIFFYAGHGQTDKDGEMFLATGSDYNTYSKLSIGDLINAVSSLKCRSIIILDSCYSGMADPKNPIYSNDFASSLSDIFASPWYDMSKVNVLTSAGPREKSWESSSAVETDSSIEKHGHFTLELLKALGWRHSLDKTEFINTDNGTVTINGYSIGVKGGLSMEELYSRILKNWNDNNQKPLLYTTVESINIIPSN